MVGGCLKGGSSMEMARIENGVIVEIRGLDLEDIPMHKRVHWLPIEGTKPTSCSVLETMTGPVLTIEPTRVVRSWTVTRRPLEEQVAAIKAECQRRIYARFPQWKQANLTARGVELQDVWRTVGAWSVEEQAEADALKAAWSWIKSTRAASDALEVQSPIPLDFGDDRHWPA
jgi:hypothetical protein